MCGPEGLFCSFRGFRRPVLGTICAAFGVVQAIWGSSGQRSRSPDLDNRLCLLENDQGSRSPGFDHLVIVFWNRKPMQSKASDAAALGPRKLRGEHVDVCDRIGSVACARFPGDRLSK